MWIATTRTAGDAGIASELVLQPTDVGVLWRKLNGMLGARHLFDSHLRFTHRNLAWVVRQLIDVEQRALHLLGGVALQHMHWNAASLGIHNRRAALLELIANRDHSVSLIGSSRCCRREPEFANRRLKLLARDAMREDAQLREMADFTFVVVIGTRCLIPLRWDKRAADRSADELAIHLGDGRCH